MNLAARLLHPSATGPVAVPQTQRTVRPLPPGDELFESVYADVVDRLDTQALGGRDRDEVLAHLTQLVDETLARRGLALAAKVQERIVAELADEIAGLGPLQSLLADATISDILVNGSDQVFVERHGQIERTALRFRDNNHLLNTIHRIVAKLGRRIDESSPMVDARLPDGSRVNAIVPPLAIDGPVLSIRRFANAPVSFRELFAKGALNAAMSHYFKSAVRAGANILICGGTGVGKTTMLNALSTYISSRARIITIEDSAELQLQQAHVVRLESRPANIEGRGEVSIRDLVRNALRMRPDRIVVGEVRSDEVLDMVQAMNTGHDGSMTTIHANGVDDAFTRLVAMMSMAGSPLSESLMTQMIARALHVVVYLTRDVDGRRRVHTVSEVAGVADGVVRAHPVFIYRGEESATAGGGGEGHWHCSGHSLLLHRFAAAGVPLDPRVLGGGL